MTCNIGGRAGVIEVMKGWLFAVLTGAAVSAEPLSIEGEDATRAELSRHRWLPWIARGEGETRISLRGLNERFAGEHGRIVAKGPDFVHGKTGGKVRFWGVNGPPDELHGEELAACARGLAERGVNLVRLHGKVFDEATGELDQARVGRIHEVVAAIAPYLLITPG